MKTDKPSKAVIYDFLVLHRNFAADDHIAYAFRLHVNIFINSTVYYSPFIKNSQIRVSTSGDRGDRGDCNQIYNNLQRLTSMRRNS